MSADKSGTQSAMTGELRRVADPVLAKAMAHPLRLGILTALDGRVASPRELSEELGERLGTVSYHVRTLLKLGLLRQVKTRSRRGAIEHFYEVAAHWVIPDDLWSDLPDVLRQSVVRSLLAQIGTDLHEADFNERCAHLTRTKLQLDDIARTELSTLCDALLTQLHDLADESRKRSGGKRDAAAVVEVETVVMSFRVPPRPSKLSA